MKPVILARFNLFAAIPALLLADGSVVFLFFILVMPYGPDGAFFGYVAARMQWAWAMILAATAGISMIYLTLPFWYSIICKAGVAVLYDAGSVSYLGKFRANIFVDSNSNVSTKRVGNYRWPVVEITNGGASIYIPTSLLNIGSDDLSELIKKHTA